LRLSQRKTSSGNAMEMTTEEIADGLWQQAEAYSQQALAHLWNGDDSATDPAQSREIKRIRLVIYFLFPQLADWQRSFVEVLYWQRQILKCNFQIDRNWIKPGLRQDIERLTNENEQAFMSIVTTVKQKINYESLTPVQTVLFRREFFEIPLPASPG
jgi:hypothetical protein